MSFSTIGNLDRSSGESKLTPKTFVLVRLDWFKLIEYQVIWSGTGSLVCIASEESFYVLRFERDAFNSFVESGGDLGDEGVEDAFDVVAEVNESIQSAKWVGDCLVYTSSNNRLNYLVGGQTHTISHFDTYVLSWSREQR